MTAAALIARLDRVTQSAPDRWRAICPAHESRHRTQSLAVRELDDGTLLLKCFAGCGADEIVAAVGLELRDLFPVDHMAERRHPQRARHWHAIRECVQTLHFELLICAIAAEDSAAGRPVSQADAQRAALAAERVRAAIVMCL